MLKPNCTLFRFWTALTLAAVLNLSHLFASLAQLRNAAHFSWCRSITLRQSETEHHAQAWDQVPPWDQG